MTLRPACMLVPRLYSPSGVNRPMAALQGLGSRARKKLFSPWPSLTAAYYKTTGLPADQAAVQALCPRRALHSRFEAQVLEPHNSRQGPRENFFSSTRNPYRSIFLESFAVTVTSSRELPWTTDANVPATFFTMRRDRYGNRTAI